MQKIISYLSQKYDPVSILIYGSYADGTNQKSSDFDALVISKTHPSFHDVSFIDHTQLDVFIYPTCYFDQEFDWNPLIPIADAKIALDENGFGQSLKKRVQEYIRNLPVKGPEEISDEIKWCQKMLSRTHREDLEGYFRWHWLLTDSLEIFCDVYHHSYLGPEKSLKWMQQEDPKAYQLYTEALCQFQKSSTENWIHYIETIFAESENNKDNTPSKAKDSE
jgi:hypothetical protein